MRHNAVLTIAVGLVASACSSSSGGTGPTATCTGSTITVPVLGVQTVSAADAPCVDMVADGSTYIMVPQFASGTGTQSAIGYEMGTDLPAAADLSPLIANAGPRASFSLQSKPHGVRETFDFMLREKERKLPAAGGKPGALVLRGGGPPSVGDTGKFQVCNDLSCNTFALDTSIVQYVGNHIAIYVSRNAPAGGLSGSEITALGTTFDTDLYAIDTNTFGGPSDIDNNQRVIVLLTPKVNSITPSSTCSSQGYVAGFFFGLDLVPSQPNSNGGEIFYSLVPDPSGIFSCAHSVANVKGSILGTFIHEFQHMISWNQHVIVRGGNEEEVWLNEGMSHIAEELGSRFYEAKCPYPQASCRTDPTQLFPDSSQGFIGGDIGNAYMYLEAPSASSVTLFASSGTLEERGSVWLFLRWLGDQKDSLIYGKLDQTVLTGVTNVETQSGETLQSLFGDFAMAIYSDSLPGLPRASAPARNRYAPPRNMRQIFARLNFTDPTDFPTVFPAALGTIPVQGKGTSAMKVGTMEFWKLTMPASGSDLRLHFAATGGGAFPSADEAQVTVLHCPSAAACP